MAEPLSPLGAHFSNPAGLARFTERTMGSGIGAAYGRGVVSTDFGYHAENEVLVPFLDMYLVVPWNDRWTFGIGSMGTSGARFDYGARPEVGVNSGFFSENGTMGLPIGVAYRVSDSLWLGAEIVPLYGSAHLRYTRPVAELGGADQAFRFTVDGFGIQSMFGVTWKPDDAWSLGLGVRPPGKLWADGDTKLANGKQDVDLELDVPTEVTLGILRRFGAKWTVSYGGRFIDTSVLAKNYFHFEQTPSANMAYVQGARDEWRHMLGAQYAWSDAWTLLGGVTKANGIVSDRGINPSVYDSRDWRLHTGLRWQGEKWGIDGAFAYIFGDARHVSAEDAMVFPGKFDSKPAYILSFLVSRRF